MKYRYTQADARTFNKSGVEITAYNLNNPDIDLVYESVEAGHFEEFYNDVSTFTWFIIEGKGTFVINDERVEVEAKDVVSVPPQNRIHYFGKMKMILLTTPAFEAKNEHHVRDINPNENPYR